MRKGWYVLMAVILAGCASDSGGDAVICGSGENEYTCPAGKICGENGTCIDSNDENCGAAGIQCTNGNVCQDGNCVCPTFLDTDNKPKLCTMACVQSGCVNFETDPKNCGKEGNECEAGEFCSKGECSDDCAQGLTKCGNLCIDTASDPEHCGNCDSQCPESGKNHVSMSYCQEGSCRIVCESSYIDDNDDISDGCETSVKFTCGNGIVEPGEKCDGEKLNDQSCESLVGEGSRGVVTCSANCLGFNTEDCTKATTCGNGVVDGAEVCDGTALNGATCESVKGEGSKGHLGCLDNCSGFDMSECSAPTSCGNGKLEEGEICDGTQMRDKTCESERGRGSHGTLKCASNCEFDISGCGEPAMCGNDRLEEGEVCDGTNFNGETCEKLIGKGSIGTLVCDNCGKISTENCSAPSTCGNDKIDGKEVCDGKDLNKQSCESVVGAGSTGTLRCADNCGDFDISQCTAASVCGDGMVNGNELCDGKKLNDRTCALELKDPGSTGTLTCNAKCTGFDTSACLASTTCGNGKLETGEVCDRENVKGVTCESAVGMGSVGTVLCGSDCTFLNLSGCSAPTACGNGKLDDGEVCDGKDLKGATCASVLGEGSTGTLKCGDGCKHYDTSGCSKPKTCGNGKLDDGEICDGKLMNGQTCEMIVGYGSKGFLTCKSNCGGFDTSRCTEEVTCGNGKLDPGETCDGSMLNGATCSALVGYGSTGTPKCNNTCDGYVKSSKTNRYEGCTEEQKCGNGVLDEGEKCDGYNLNEWTCEQQVGFGSTGIPKCNSTCTGYINGSCTPAMTCGNGKIDPGEQCDGSLFKDKEATCSTVVGTGSEGVLLCGSDCRYNTTQCKAPTGCGNGSIDGKEQCDGKAFYEEKNICSKYAPEIYRSGSLVCTNECKIDTSECNLWCGNGSVNNTSNGVVIGEKCDGDKFPTSANTCAKVVGPGSTGTLACASDCKSIITSGCTEPTVCGDGKVNQSSEACDGNSFRAGSADCSVHGNYLAGTSVTCTSDCKINTSACKEKPFVGCGDGIVNNNEYCDGTKFLDNTDACSEWDTKYGAGKVTCNKDCTVNMKACVLAADVKKCGNGKVDDNEFCDGTLFYADNNDCSAYSSEYVSGKLKCTSSCEIDESQCKKKAAPKCGDGNIDANEVCDGTKLGLASAACNKYDPNMYEKGTIKCASDCSGYDFSGCTKLCGNGSVNISKGEVCDGENLNAKTCAKIVGAGSEGTLKCNADCRSFDTSGCSQPNTCGNGKLDGDEDCDGTAFLLDEKTCKGWSNLYTSGSVTCNKDCTINFSACKTEAQPVCGDGIVNQTTEECDKNSLDTATYENWSCSQFDSGNEHYTGTMTCGNDCKLNIDNCVLAQVKTCGNGKLDDNEFCDGSLFLDNENQCSDWGPFTSGTVKCNSNCELDLSACKNNTCGDGVVGDDEWCDKTQFLEGFETCTGISSNYSGGTPKCKADCTLDESTCIRKCGNGKLDADEWCDPNKGNPIFDKEADTCADWIEGSEGTLKCTSTCEIDTTGCRAKPTAYCGDGAVNTASEECDGSAFLLNEKTCKGWSNKYASGNVTCNKDCTVNYSACVEEAPKCGNGKLDDDEYCDGTAFMYGIKTCADYSSNYNSGMLKCSKTCDIDTSGCSFVNPCGNGKLDNDEWCDGTLFLDNQDSCADWGDFVSGKVTCSRTCEILTTNCVKPAAAKCGDGKLNQATEDCDGTEFLLNVKTCKDYSPTLYSGGNLKCTNGCKYDFSGCTKVPTSRCGDGKVDEDLNEDCDGNAFYADESTCNGYSPSTYSSGKLKCTSACKYDFSDCVSADACTEDDIRCVFSTVQMCGREKDGSPLQWMELEACTGAKPICNEENGECEAAPAEPVDLQWCTFHWLATDNNNIGYGRVLYPEGYDENNSLTYMACTTDLNKPVKQWKIINANYNPNCSNCGNNKEFMSEPYAGKAGTNYCTFIVEFDSSTFACQPRQQGESKPTLITDTTKLTADATRQFSVASSGCEEFTYQCNGNTLEACLDGIWQDYETCKANETCSAAAGDCVANTGITYNNSIGFTQFKATTSYAGTKEHSWSDGSKITLDNVAVYTETQVIDGATIIMKRDKSSKITISGLKAGVGTLSFKYALWKSTSEPAATLKITAGSNSQTIEIPKTGTTAKTWSHEFNHSTATTVTIDITAGNRVLIDDIAFNNAK